MGLRRRVSGSALQFLQADDEALYRTLTPHLETWPDIKIVHNDTAIPVALATASAIRN